MNAESKAKDVLLATANAADERSPEQKRLILKLTEAGI